MTAVEWLFEQLQAPCRGIPSHIIEQAKKMEEEQQYETKAFWFGRGVLANPHHYPECYWQCTCSSQPCSCCQANDR